jgi:hypothetical protein
MPTNVPFGFRTGFQSRGSRFGMGLGVLNVSRGYGPLAEPEEVVPPIKAKEGGAGGKILRAKRPRPKTVLIRIPNKQKKKKRARRKAA